jgi:FAD/FMN-containing dehydrogenase
MIPGLRGVFRVDDAARAVYSEAAGIARIVPHGVAVPADSDDVVTLVRWAADRRRPLVPRGSGSSMAGGAIGEGLVVDLSRLREPPRIDAGRRTITVTAGVRCAEVMEVAATAGRRFPVDPSSARFCTIGGMIATNAAGAHSLGAGAMRRWVRAVDCVFADGSRHTIRRGEALPDIPALRAFLDHASPERRAAWTRACRHPGVRKESSGYALADFADSGDLVDVLVGSEGTLAIVTAAELALESPPAAVVGMSATFASLDAAAAAAIEARRLGAAACELLDGTFLRFTGRAGGAGDEAMLLCEVEGASAADADRAAARLEDGCRDAGATATRLASDAGEQRELWDLRHAASPMLARLDPSLRSMQFVEDGAVPPPHLAAYVQSVRDALDRQRMRGVVFGHAGDAHVHVNPLVPIADPDWRDRVEALLTEVTGRIAVLGGTLAGEHGDGRLRAPLLAAVWSREAVDAFAAVKRCFDPDGILNPGAKIATGAPPIGIVKYDPAAAPLPASAAAALHRVERERCYDRFRLELLGS